jgi:O-acetyl-ADP-ribose deacetylase (regulator of RNase III)
MSVNYVNGNLLDMKTNFICHQVNCQGVMGSGLAKQIRDKWPCVYDVYKKRVSPKELGKICLVNIVGNIPIQGVINMFAQDGYGCDRRRYTSYDAFWNCLHEIKNILPKGDTIAFPDHIGCGLGGANWNIIRAMIEEVLGADYEVYIVKY